MNRIDVKYEQLYMDNPLDKYYYKVLDTLVDYNDHHNAPFSNEKLWQVISKVMAETEEEERNIT